MARPKKPQTLAEQIAQLDDPAPNDFDPEELEYKHGSDDQSSEDESLEAEFDGREHYVEVSKGKLQGQSAVSLGPRYEGSRVSRDALDVDDDDDLFAKQIYEDGSEGESEAQPSDISGADGDAGHTGLVGRGPCSDDHDEFDDDDQDQTDRSVEGPGGTDEESDEDSEVQQKTTSTDTGIDRAELRRKMREEQKSVASSISQAVRADIEKGQAVKCQRTIFDSLLNTRIKLQKGLIATNSFEAAGDEPLGGAKEVIQAAEAAAFNLLNSLNSLRQTLSESRAGSKRKRSVICSSTPSGSIWTEIQADDAEALPHWNAALNKWSVKTRGASAVATSRRLNNTTQQQSLVDVLTSDLADITRLVKRTRVPRSCAPVQAAKGVTESQSIYDDADFYGLLLKELLERRGQDTAAEFTPHWQAAREAKTKKVVDTRASKGRKLRYTVHEKLQNFMAPENRCTWSERQTDELFSSLFGQRTALAEDLDDEDGDDDIEVRDAAETGILLFSK